jgi:hypothetical protein
LIDKHIEEYHGMRVKTSEEAGESRKRRDGKRIYIIEDRSICVPAR